jgi:hypothetical protein
LDRFAPDDDSPLGEVTLLRNLGHQIPLLPISSDDRRGDEFGPDVRLGERFLVLDELVVVHEGSQFVSAAHSSQAGDVPQR